MSSQTVTDSCPRGITTLPSSQRSERGLPEPVQPVGSDETAGFVLDWELPNHPSEGTPARTGREASAREDRPGAGGAHGPAAIGSSGPRAGVNANVAAPLPAPPGGGSAGVSPDDLDPTGPGEAPATTRPVTVVKPSAPPASADRDRAATPLELRRARRAARLGMADHPAGGARNTYRTTRGAQHDPT